MLQVHQILLVLLLHLRQCQAERKGPAPERGASASGPCSRLGLSSIGSGLVFDPWWDRRMVRRGGSAQGGVPSRSALAYGLLAEHGDTLQFSCHTRQCWKVEEGHRGLRAEFESVRWVSPGDSSVKIAHRSGQDGGIIP